MPLDFVVVTAKSPLPLVLKAPLTSEVEELFQKVETDLPIQISEDTKGTGFVFDEGGLSFHDEEMGILHFDLLNSKDYARQAHRGKSELIAKAVGLSKGPQKVFDGTVGLGQDAWFLAQIGAEVEGCERSPIVFLLLSEALIRANEKRIRLFYGDSQKWLKQHFGQYSTIYLDPMFPEKKKSALPRKEMRIFKKWVGEDADAFELLQTSLRSGAERVVVKRPLKATPLKPGFIHSFKGRAVRYDLYIPNFAKGE